MSSLCSLLFAAVLLAAPNYRITGTVHSARDGSALPQAHLRLTPASNEGAATSDNGTPIEAYSDNLGHFTITAPGSGRWVITASARGFHQQGYLEHEQYQSALVLSPGTPTLDLDLRLEPDASIVGTVLDEAGEPVRDAQVTLFSAPPRDAEINFSPRGPLQVRATDDLGHYELSGLETGRYRVAVSARPWYASSSRTPSASSGSPLDVVYPMTWYPGATDAEAADVITLKPGDTHEVDFSLLAIPATHLRASHPSPSQTPGGRSRTTLPQLDRISGSMPSFVPPSLTFNSAGQAELGGLSPGLYRVRFPGAADSSGPVFLRITANSPSELDLTAALPAVHVAFTLGGLPPGRSTQVTLTDVLTGARFDFFPPPPEASAGTADAPLPGRRRLPGRFLEGRTLDVPAGRYRVTLSGNDAIYLTGIRGTGATIHGDLVDLRESNVSLTLQIETGPATVRGFCLLRGKPVAGAMVVLVPASLGQPGSIPLLLRDQSDSDGSFLLPHVIPAPYILIAIQDGWNLNWRDPATLERFLLHGVPLAPARAETVQQNVEVQFP